MLAVRGGYFLCPHCRYFDFKRQAIHALAIAIIKPLNKVNAMQERANALCFLDPSCHGRLSASLRDTISRVDCKLQGRSNTLRVRALSMGDWGLAAIDGQCRGVTRYDDQSFARLTYAALTLALDDRGSSARLPAGHILFTRRPLQETVFPEQPFSYLSLYIPDDYLRGTGDRNIPESYLIDARTGPGLVVRTALLSLMQEGMISGHNLSLSVLLPGLCQMAMSVINKAASTTIDNVSSETRWARILRYLHSRYSDPELNAAEIAKTCCISERQLYREFDRHGSSFAAQLRTLRLQHAKSMLVQEPEKSLSEIAAACGFSCSAVFSRTFRKAFATTPRDFRREMTPRQSPTGDCQN